MYETTIKSQIVEFCVQAFTLIFSIRTVPTLLWMVCVWTILTFQRHSKGKNNSSSDNRRHNQASTMSINIACVPGESGNIIVNLFLHQANNDEEYVQYKVQ